MRLKIPGVFLAGLLVAGACTDVGAAPDVPMAIELLPLPSPSIVAGDTLRNEAGVVTPVRAIVRNSAGEEIPGASPHYLYADFNRDSALQVDSTSGMIVALKSITAEARIAARIGSNLQILRNLIVTQQPDTVTGNAPDTLFVTLPDSAHRNRTGAFTATVRHTSGTTPVSVNGWLVRYELLHPANPSNDTTAAAYLVSDNMAPTVLDTTDSNGGAGRLVRVRAGLFPGASAQNGVDSVVVRITVRYKGEQIGGSPLTLVAPVRRSGADPKQTP